VSYLELIPLLVRGIQEQQELLAGQETLIRQLTAEKDGTGAALTALRGRLAELESAVKRLSGEH
jgi:Tfp pilus assembly protein PilO